MKHPISFLSRCAAVGASLAAAAFAQTPPGACILEDTAFMTAEGGCKDLATGAVWSAEAPIGNYAFAEAYCADLVEGGFDDWRIPTLTEMQEFCADGAYTHVQTGAPGWRYYVLTNGGNVGTIIALETCETKKKVAVWNSYLASFCIRGVTPQNGKGGKGGKNKTRSTPAGSGATEDSGPAQNRDEIQVHHEYSDGRWQIHVTAPRYRNMPYALVVSGLPVPASPSMPGTPEPAPAMTVLGELRTLDQQGRADVTIDALARRLRETTVKWHLSMVLLDGERGAGVRGVIPLVRPSDAERP